MMPMSQEACFPIQHADFGPMKLGTLSLAPLVSVLIPNYNYGEFIGEALDSLTAQTYTNWEALVCDDGSTDSSREIIELYAMRDQRIRPIYQRNSGVAAALNACFGVSSGDIISLLDADDVYNTGKLEAVIKAFSAHAAAGLVAHPMRRITGSGRIYGHTFPQTMSTGWLGDALIENGGDLSFPLASALSFRREVAIELFPIRPGMQRLIDGYLMRAAALMTEVHGISTPLADYRIHEKNLTGVRSHTPESLKQITEDVWIELEEVNQFIVRRYGTDPSRVLRAERSASYVTRLLAYRLFTGQLREGSPEVRELLGQVHPAVRRLGWKILMSLPSWIGRNVYNTYVMHHS